MDLEDKIDIVKSILKDKKVAIGFSGGADSTLIAYLSSKVAADTLAITINNHLLPTGFVENTKNIAQTFNVKHEIADIDFYENKYFLSNTSSRCYECRKLMYSQIKRIAEKRGFDFICDGNNISDLVIDRPGILVTYKNEFKTPFIEAKLTSKEIHGYLNKNNIPYYRSTTCLATRIPTGTPTTREKISKIRYCEDFISSNTKCEIVKVRDLENIDIVEVDEISEILKEDKFKHINDELKKHGFKKVALNLSQIDDDETIKISYHEGSFSYLLPYTINIENTKKQLKNEITYINHEKISLKNMDINRNGLIRGYDFRDYENALDSFMELLKKIRRNV